MVSTVLECQCDCQTDRMRERASGSGRVMRDCVRVSLCATECVESDGQVGGGGCFSVCVRGRGGMLYIIACQSSARSFPLTPSSSMSRTVYPRESLNRVDVEHLCGWWSHLD